MITWEQPQRESLMVYTFGYASYNIQLLRKHEKSLICPEWLTNDGHSYVRKANTYAFYKLASKIAVSYDFMG